MAVFFGHGHAWQGLGLGDALAALPPRLHYAILQDVRAGDVALAFVPDAENAADFLTKWVSKANEGRDVHRLPHQP